MPVFLEALDTAEAYDPASPLRETFRFKVNFADFATGADVDIPELPNMFVIPGVHYIGGLYATAHSMSKRFVEFVAEDPEPTRQLRSEGNRSKSDAVLDKLLQDFPWLLDLYDTEAKAKAKRKAKTDDPSEDSESESYEVPDVDEEQRERNLQAIDEARARLDASGRRYWDDFKIDILGGADLFERTGRPFDFICSSFRGLLAQDFCKRRGTGQTFRADHDVYGEHCCQVLCRAWCHRLQYYYELEKSAPAGHALVFIAAHHAAYIEPTEFQDMVATYATHHRELMKRVVHVRKLCQCQNNMDGWG